MKKLITLIACVLMGGSAMGQELVVNGNLEGEQEADWSSFWIQDPSKEAQRNLINMPTSCLSPHLTSLRKVKSTGWCSGYVPIRMRR